MKYLIGLVVVFIFTAYGQQRILIKPNDEVIPLEKGERVADIIKRQTYMTHTDCGSNSFRFGYPPDSYNPTSSFGSFHKDVLGMWFIAQANGTLDTLYWRMNDVGNFDSTISIRIFKSNIYHGQGPGFSPYPPPCVNWGYYLDTNDLDNGITPFHDRATDTQWISTASIALPTFDPLSDELWGNGGFTFRVQPNSVNALPLDTLGYSIVLKKGDAFFITMQINSPNRHLTPEEEDRTAMYAWGSSERVSMTDENYPSRLWKFYEHDSGASNCTGSGVPTRKGWVARGPFHDDTLFTSAYNWWYSMTVNSIFPPVITNFALKSGTAEGEPIRISFIKLCSLSDSDKVGTYWVHYKFNNEPWDSVKAAIASDSVVQAVIPQQPAGTTVTWRYWFFGVDSTRYFSSVSSFIIVGLKQKGYTLDTTLAYNWIDADSTYTQVGRFFLRPGADPFLDPTDDGTAGPIDIGFPFRYFGEDVQYAWIGVDGAISLTSSPTDTQHINSNSSFTSSWNIPYPQLQPYGLPKNIIVPYYRDYHLDNFTGDPPPIYSTIRYKAENDIFIVEWNFKSSHFYSDNDGNFRLMLNKTDSSISFIYNTIDTVQIAKTALVGFQADSSRWFHVCKNGRPSVFIPRPSTVFKFTPSIAVSVKEQVNVLPAQFKLEQNYPNPFNPSTVIRYQLPVNSWVTLKIYNLLGQEVATLINEYQDAGFKSVEWKPRDMASGLFFYKLTTE